MLTAAKYSTRLSLRGCLLTRNGDGVHLARLQGLKDVRHGRHVAEHLTRAKPEALRDDPPPLACEGPQGQLELPEACALVEEERKGERDGGKNRVGRDPAVPGSVPNTLGTQARP